MSFGNARRHTTLARSAYLDGSDLGHRPRAAEQTSLQPEDCLDSRAAAGAQKRRELAPKKAAEAFGGAFGAVSGSVGPQSETPGLPDRRLRRSPPSKDATAAGFCRPLESPLPGGQVPDIDGRGHRRVLAKAKSKPERTLKRHDRHNDVKISREQAQGDFQGRAFFDQIVLAERYANLIGRPEKLPGQSDQLMSVPEDLGMAGSEQIPSSYPGALGPEDITLDQAPLPTLLGSVQKAPEDAEDAKAQQQPRRFDPHYASPRSLAGKCRSLKASISHIAQESISFGRLLREAQSALEDGGSTSRSQVLARTRHLHQQLDALEAKTRSLTAVAQADNRPSTGTIGGGAEPSTPRISEAGSSQAWSEQRRKEFDLIKRGTGWRTMPNTSQV
mmetsp:Transcript_18805/g.42378  ORF Transcript_18805/g.42378 Transcript_18805/m.42378 type:complete len:388 (+) Transcript_18805:45-1208(+)